MAKRDLNNGHRLTRVDVPNGEQYYVDAGPEGKILILDTALVPPSDVLAALAWHFDRELPSGPKTPHLDFNMMGTRI